MQRKTNGADLNAKELLLEPNSNSGEAKPGNLPFGVGLSVRGGGGKKKKHLASNEPAGANHSNMITERESGLFRLS